MNPTPTRPDRFATPAGSTSWLARSSRGTSIAPVATTTSSGRTRTSAPERLRRTTAVTRLPSLVVDRLVAVASRRTSTSSLASSSGPNASAKRTGVENWNATVSSRPPAIGAVVPAAACHAAGSHAPGRSARVASACR